MPDIHPATEGQCREDERLMIVSAVRYWQAEADRLCSVDPFAWFDALCHADAHADHLALLFPKHLRGRKQP